MSTKKTENLTLLPYRERVKLVQQRMQTRELPNGVVRVVHPGGERLAVTQGTGAGARWVDK